MVEGGVMDGNVKRLLAALGRAQSVLLNMQGKTMKEMCDNLLAQLDGLDAVMGGDVGLRLKELWGPMLSGLTRFADEAETAARELSEAVGPFTKPLEGFVDG